MKLISIIIPVYNIEKKFLDKCIESVINQTYSNLEIILVDDGSLARFSQIYDEYSLKDKRVQVVHKENGGVSSARNKGIDIAKGEFIVFVDGDDWIKSNFCEEIIRNIGENEIIIFDLYIKRRNTINRNKFFPHRKVFVNSEKELLQAQGVCFKSPYIHNPEYNSVALIASKAYKSSFIKNYNLRFNIGQKMSEDILFNLYAFELASSIKYIDIPMYYYRNDNISACRSFDRDYINTNNILINQILRFINKFNKQNTEVERSLYYRSLFNIQLILKNYIFSMELPDNYRKEEFTKLYQIEWIKDSINKFSFINDNISGRILLILFKKRYYYLLKLILLYRNKIKEKIRS